MPEQGTSSGSQLLAELTRDEAGRRVPDATVILPTAAIEQHGPHLPIVTDTYIVEAVATRAAALASAPVLVAPTLCYGASQHHFPFPGVLSLSSATFGGAVRDLLASLARWGARRVYLLNGHGGNDELIRLIAREEAPLLNLAIGAASYWSLAWEGLLALDAHYLVGPLPGHAGGFETSLMLALRPDLVHPERRLRSREPFAVSTWPHGSRGTVALPRGDDPGPGTSDDAQKATAQWGERLFEAIVREVAAALDTFHQDTSKFVR